MPFQSINPTTEEPLRSYPQMSDREVAGALDAAYSAWLAWRERDFDTRAALLNAVAALLRSRSATLAELMALEMGKPVAQGRAEAEKCAWACEHYAVHARAMLADEAIATDATRSYVTFKPLGPILAVMPWNFPLWQVFRFVAPALMAGNAVLLKHAPNVLGCALASEGLLREAGAPEALFRVLTVDIEQVELVSGDRRVAAVTVTGSRRAGRAVAEAAGRALKRSVLELGGSDPYLILADADVEAAASACAASRLINSGQSCIAAKRFIVVDSVREEFERLFVDRMRRAVVGDPRDPSTDVGPLARSDLRETLHRQVTESTKQGARLLLGGELPSGPGYFYPPTVLTEVGPGMPVYEEETFGPVAAIIPARDETEAIRIANDSPYGLGAAVFTRDIRRGEEIAARGLEAGNVFVNAFVKSDPRLPFGGIKESGYGRELSTFGIREFVNVKTIYVK